jgi:hypothetical protein
MTPFVFHISQETWDRTVADLRVVKAHLEKRLERVSIRRHPKVLEQLREVERRIKAGIPVSVKCRGCGRIDLPSDARTDQICCRGCGSNNTDPCPQISEEEREMDIAFYEDQGGFCVR